MKEYELIRDNSGIPNMTSRQRLKIGDIFQVSIDTINQKYFQFVARDKSQLDSDVVRVFDETYLSTEPIDISKIISGEVDFYCHVFLKNGIRQNFWEKAGHSDEVGKLDIMFRKSSDYGNPDIKISHNWYVWRMNEPYQRIGKLTHDYHNVDIGVVMAPHNVVDRMRSGTYKFVYPDY